MSEAALRSLLASFVIEVDKTGELAKGNAAIDALKSRLGDLQAELNKVRAPAAAAGKAIHQAFQQGWGSVPGLADALKQQAQSKTANLFGQFGAAQGISGYAAPIGPEKMGAQFGPTRATLDSANAAAAKYATTLRGRLAGAVQSVRDGFNGGAAASGGGKGLIESLATVRNGFLALAGGATVAGVKHLVDSIGDIGEGAQRLGVSTDQFQRLRVLADQNNTSVEALGTAFRNLSNAAVQPTKQTEQSFRELGVSVKDGSGQFKSANDLFFDTTAALAGVTDETKRNALAQDLLGRSALELKPLFANGTAAVNEQRKALAELNVLSKETIEQADGVSDTWKKLPLLFEVAAEPLIKLLLPALGKFTDLLVKGTDALGKFLKQTDFVSVGLAAMSSVLLVKLLPGLANVIQSGGGVAKTFGAMARKGWEAYAPIAELVLAFLLIEDFITFLRGGDSETGRLAAKLFGKDGADQIRKDILAILEAAKQLFNYLTGGEVDKGALGKRLAQTSLGKDWKPTGPQQSTGKFEDLPWYARAIGHLTGATPENILRERREAGIDPTTGRPLSMPIPALPPTGFYGPPTAGGSAGGNAPVFGDTNVTVNMNAGASPGDVGRAVVGAEQEERNRQVAAYGGFL